MLVDSPSASAPPVSWRRSGLRCCRGDGVAPAAARVPLWKGRLRGESAQARAAVCVTCLGLEAHKGGMDMEGSREAWALRVVCVARRPAGGAC